MLNLALKHNDSRTEKKRAFTSQRKVSLKVRQGRRCCTRVFELGFPFFPEFQLFGKREVFKKIPGILKILGISGMQEVFLELDYFAIFSDFEHLRSNF